MDDATDDFHPLRLRSNKTSTSPSAAPILIQGLADRLVECLTISCSSCSPWFLYRAIPQRRPACNVAPEPPPHSLSASPPHQTRAQRQSPPGIGRSNLLSASGTAFSLTATKECLVVPPNPCSTRLLRRLAWVRHRALPLISRSTACSTPPNTLAAFEIGLANPQQTANESTIA
jgi:hypothetical protein